MFIKRILVLTGVHAGQTRTYSRVAPGLKQVRSWSFVKGRIELAGDDVDVDKFTKYLGVCYQAFPEGSIELARAQERDREYLAAKAAAKERRDGGSHALPAPEPRDPASIPSGPRPAREEHPTEAPAVGGGHDDALGGQPVPAGSSEGNGESPESARLRAAMKGLDPENDEHWTAAGAPRVDAVAELSGSPEVARADVERAWPELTREAARAERAEQPAAE
jgi:hypothetical protein